MLDMSAASVPLISTLNMSNTVVKSSLLEKQTRSSNNRLCAWTVQISLNCWTRTYWTAYPLYHCWWCLGAALPTLWSVGCYAAPCQTYHPPIWEMKPQFHRVSTQFWKCMEFDFINLQVWKILENGSYCMGKYSCFQDCYYYFLFKNITLWISKTIHGWMDGWGG